MTLKIRATFSSQTFPAATAHIWRTSSNNIAKTSDIFCLSIEGRFTIHIIFKSFKMQLDKGLIATVMHYAPESNIG